MAYFMSLGHSFIPHHHHDENTEHHHHHHASDTEEEHDHIAHHDHYDNDLLDYLACVFGEHHSGEDCITYEEIITGKSTQKNKNATPYELSNPFLLGDITFFQNNHYQFDLLVTGSTVSGVGKRGPPQA